MPHTRYGAKHNRPLRHTVYRSMSELLAAEVRVAASKLASAPRQQSHPELSVAADPHRWRGFVFLSLFYLASVAALSWVKLLWLDELITLHIARLGNIKAIYSALSAGADPNPPLIHLAVMLCRQLLGEHAFVLRMPAIFGYWLGMLALFLFLRSRIPVRWALVGTLMSMDMGAFEWSYESRSYAVFYGFTMLAFYCWSRLGDVRQSPYAKNAAICGVTLSLAAGLCTNYFAVLAFFPIAAAEVTLTVVRLWPHRATLRTAQIRKSIRWQVWFAMAIAATPLLFFRPLIRKSIALYLPYAWNKVTINRAMDGYIDIVDKMIWPLLVLFVLAIAIELLSKLCAGDRARIWPRWLGTLADPSSPIRSAKLLTAPETAAVSVFIAYPFVGCAVASLQGGMLSPRFILPVCFGCAIAGVLLLYRLFGHLRHAGAIALVLPLVWFAVRESSIGYTYEVQKESLFRMFQHIPPPDYPGQPIAVSDNLLLLPFQFYAPPAIASRVVDPIDFSGTMRSRGEASGDMNLWAGRNLVYHFPIIPLATLQRNTSTYIIVAAGPDWLVDELRAHHYIADSLLINTEAAALEFRTPLAHGQPYLLWASGDRFPAGDHPPIPFELSDNLPKTTR